MPPTGHHSDMLPWGLGETQATDFAKTNPTGSLNLCQDSLRAKSEIKFFPNFQACLEADLSLRCDRPNSLRHKSN